jgi:hypothetical protein
LRFAHFCISGLAPGQLRFGITKRGNTEGCELRVGLLMQRGADATLCGTDGLRIGRDGNAANAGDIDNERGVWMKDGFG